MVPDTVHVGDVLQGKEERIAGLMVVRRGEEGGSGVDVRGLGEGKKAQPCNGWALRGDFRVKGISRERCVSGHFR
jgi:hypothetical protein